MKSIIAQEPDFKWQIDRVIVSGSTVAAELDGGRLPATVHMDR